MEKKIIDKIRKLSAKAESSKEIGNIAEASAFSAKVSQLLVEHNLQMSDISTEETPSVNGFEFDDLDLKNSQGSWMSSLLGVLSEYNFCETILNQKIKRKFNKKGKVVGVKDGHPTCTIIGRPENVEVVKYLFEILRGQFESMGKKEWNAYLKSVRNDVKNLRSDIDKSDMISKPWKYFDAVSPRGKFMKSFFIGAVNGVHQKLKEEAEAAKEQYGQKITDLMIINDAGVQAYLKEYHPNVKMSSRRRKRIDSNAYNKGINVGKNASMARGLNTGDKIPTKMLE